MAENQQSTASVVVDNIGNFDFADYISRFSGDAKILRAEYIAERCPPLAAAAFAAMVDEYKKSMNTVGYKQSLARLASSVGIDATPDNVWLSKIDKEAHYLYEKLDRELTAAKSSVNKNAIRACHFNMGDYYVERGEFTSAVKCYMRARDFCKEPELGLELLMRITNAQMLGGQYQQAASHGTRAERAAEGLDRNQTRASWLAGVQGVSALSQGNYRMAARWFTAVRMPASLDDAPATNAKPGAAAAATATASAGGKRAQTNDDDDDDKLHAPPSKSGTTPTATPAATSQSTPSSSSSSAKRFDSDATLPPGVSVSDAALIGGLCMLASGDRADVRKRVLDSETFASIVAREPELRALLEDFLASRYSSALARLDVLRPRLLLDLHLGAHTNVLVEKIRRRALVQYTMPYSSVDLNVMASAFKTTVAVIEADLAALIVEDQIVACIDSANKRLYARNADERVDTFEKAITAGDAFAHNARAMLLRVNLRRA